MVAQAFVRDREDLHGKDARVFRAIEGDGRDRYAARNLL